MELDLDKQTTPVSFSNTKRPRSSSPVLDSDLDITQHIGINQEKKRKQNDKVPKEPQGELSAIEPYSPEVSIVATNKEKKNQGKNDSLLIWYMLNQQIEAASLTT